MSGELCISYEPSAAWYWPRPINQLPEEHYYYSSSADWEENNNNLPILGSANNMQLLN